MADRANIAGLVLAGGASRRMGREKAFTLLAGRPLLAHVLARFAPQVERLAIGANGDARRFEAFGLPVFADALAPRCGPLAGILVGLDFAQSCGCEALAVVPSDAPFLPRDFVARLARARAAHEIAAARGPAGPEPLFSLWPLTARDEVAAALAQGRFGVLRLLERAPRRYVDFPSAQPDPFFNLNSPADIETAQRELERQT